MIAEDDLGAFSAADAGTLIIAKGIKVDTYLYFLSWLRGSIKGEISPLEIILTLALSEDGKALPIPFPQFYRKGYKIGRYHYTDWQEIYRNKLLSLVFDLGEEGKEIYQGEHGLQKGKTGIEDYLAFKKTLLLFDWIGSREIRSIEQEYSLYRGAVKRLGEGFSWLADSLAAVAEEAGWKKEREEDLKKIRCLSEQLVEGVEEEGQDQGAKKEKEAKKSATTSCYGKSVPYNLQTVLEIDKHRPDRIIFLGKKIEVTSTEFSLIHLLAQHPEQVMSYDELLDELWKDEEYAIYNRVSFHISKIRRTILKTIGKRKMNEEKVKDIFVVVPKRGVMLKLKAEEIKIN